MKPGDIVRLLGRQDALFVFSDLDHARYTRVPAGPWALFLAVPGSTWSDQLCPLEYAVPVASPMWQPGLRCKWQGFDAIVAGVTDTHVHVQYEESTVPVEIAAATAANISIFLNGDHNETQAQRQAS